MLVNTIFGGVTTTQKDFVRNNGSDDSTEFLGYEFLTKHTAIDHRVRVHVYLPKKLPTLGDHFHYVLDNDSVPHLL